MARAKRGDAAAMRSALPRSMSSVDVSALHPNDQERLIRVTTMRERTRIHRVGDSLAEPETVVVSVDNPLATIRGEKSYARRVLRGDFLAGLLARRQIDEAQFAAGRKWQQYAELSEIGNVKAIDPAKEAVDGGKLPDVLTDKQVQAFKQLAAARKELGMEGEALVKHILGERMNIAQAAAVRGLRTESERDYVGRRFRECLLTLAKLWNYADQRCVLEEGA